MPGGRDYSAQLAISRADWPKRSFELRGRKWTVGRGMTNQVVFRVGNLSRVHMILVANDGDLWIADTGSTNGTYVNGRRIDRFKLSVGDRIYPSDFVMVVESLPEPIELLEGDAPARWLDGLPDTEPVILAPRRSGP